MSSVLTKRVVLTAEPRDRAYEFRGAQVRVQGIYRPMSDFIDRYNSFASVVMVS